MRGIAITGDGSDPGLAWAEDFWANAIWREEGGVRGLKQNIEGETDIRVYRL